MHSQIAYICTLCGAEYIRLPYGGYCDESMKCAADDGEHLVAVGDT